MPLFFQNRFRITFVCVNCVVLFVGAMQSSRGFYYGLCVRSGESWSRDHAVLSRKVMADFHAA